MYLYSVIVGNGDVVVVEARDANVERETLFLYVDDEKTKEPIIKAAFSRGAWQTVTMEKI